MAVLVVDRLEVVDIHDDQRQRLAKAPRPLALLLQDLFQAVTVGHQGQGIALGQVAVLIELALQLLVDPGQLAGALGDLRFQAQVLFLQPINQAPGVIDIAVGTEHPRHRTILVARNYVAAVLDPQVAAVPATTAVLDAVPPGAISEVILEMRHHPRIVLGVDHPFPGQHRIVEGMARVAEHPVPPGIAVDVTGVGIPVPDPVADQLQQGL
ncbi:hypothetical protein D3C76_1258230 [compost metagenome]